jgi:hypothetical protein
MSVNIRVSDIYPDGVGRELLGVGDNPSAVVASGSIGEIFEDKKASMKTFLAIVLALVAIRIFYDMLPSS